MRLILSAIGKSSNDPEQELVERYVQRAGPLARQLGFGNVEVKQSAAPRENDGPTRREKEADLLRAHAPAGAIHILLDERGKNLSSKDFAQLLMRLREQGAPALALHIGGADGHAPSLTSEAQSRISFGAATWPHLLVRAMLAEQVYRAMTILSNHPYHRV